MDRALLTTRYLREVTRRGARASEQRQGQDGDLAAEIRDGLP